MKTLLSAFVLVAVGCGPPAEQVPGDNDVPPECPAPSSWYKDADGDGFGSTLDAPKIACAQPLGFVGNQLDKADGDARANPAQTAFQPTAIIGQRSTALTFDFNFDGTEEPEKPSNYGECNWSGSTCIGKGAVHYWRGEKAPACGETGTWIFFCNNCNATEQVMVRTCR